MAFLLPLLFLLPIVELYLLIRVGGYLGPLPTILLVLGAGVAGIVVLRRQGTTALQRVATRLQAGEVPAEEVAEGALIAAAGLLLLLPGFVSDALALLLLVPIVRVRLAGALLARQPRGGAHRRPGSVVLEGEFERRPGEDDVSATHRELPRRSDDGA